VNISCDGLVLYTDGSFRRNQAGWGVHGYAYENTPLDKAVGEKQLPTSKGYQVVELNKTVKPVQFIDAYGPVTQNPTNNSAELQAVISAFDIATQFDTSSVLMLMDSEYVRKGINNVPKWIKNNWTKPDGSPYANKGYWSALHTAKLSWESSGRSVEFQWVKGHSGNLGNDKADANALLASGGKPIEHAQVKAPAIERIKPLELNPLMMKSRTLFTLGSKDAQYDGYYYTYHLGRLHTYGHKQDDSAMDKIRKTDLILGRRNSEACYSVFKANEPIEYIETLKQYHINAHERDVVDLGIIRLDVAYKASTQDAIRTHGEKALVNLEPVKALVTAQDEVVTITLDPPRMALRAVEQFNLLRRRLDDVLENRIGDGVRTLDLTDLFYEKVTSGKKEVLKLHRTITSATQAIEVKAIVRETPVDLKLVVGIDLPSRNALAKLAMQDPKVTLLIVADGPVSYSFSTVFETTEGSAIYQAPYTQFVLKL